MKIFEVQKTPRRRIISILNFKFSIKRKKVIFEQLKERLTILYIKKKLHSLFRTLPLGGSQWKIGNVLFYVPNHRTDFIQRKIVNENRFFEQDILEELNSYIPDDAIILDIGANIGNHSLYWATQKKAHKIIAFEPVAETFFILKKNIEINKLEDKIEAYNIGLSDIKSKADLKKFTKRNIGATSIRISDDGNLNVDALDNLNLDLPRIDFVKIDVEGHEQFTLKGMEKTLRKYTPPVFIEAFDINYPITNSILVSYGYKQVKQFDAGNYLYLIN